MNRNITAIALLGLLVTIASCERGNQSPAEQPIKVAPHRHVQPQIQGTAPAPGILSALPKDTLGLFWITNLQDLMKKMGWEELKKANPAESRTASLASKAAMGVDLTNMSNWTQLGIDLSGPAGFALLSVEKEQFAVFAQLSSAGRFEEMAHRLANRARLKIQKTKIGRCSSLEPTPRPGVSLRDKMTVLLCGNQLIVVSAWNAKHSAYDTAKRLTKLKKNRSLAGVKSVVSNATNRPYLAWGWSNVGQLVSHYEKFVAQQSKRQMKTYWQVEFERAQRRGATPDQMATLKKHLEEEKRWAARHKERKKAELKVIKDVWASVSDAFMGLTLDGQTIKAHGKLNVGRKGYLRKLLRNRSQTPPIINALTQAPSTLVDINIHSNMVNDVIAKLVALDGGDYKAIDRDIKKMTAMTIAQISKIISGGAGFGISLNSDKFPSQGFEEATISFSAVGDIQNADNTRKLLHNTIKFASRALKATYSKKSDSWSFAEGDSPPVYLKVTDSQLTASTDPSFPNTPAKSKKATGWAHSLSPAVRTELQSNPAAITIAMDPALMLLYMMPYRASYDSELSSKAISAEQKALAKKIEAVKKQHKALTKRHDQEQIKLMKDVSQLVGYSVIKIQSVSDGIQATAGQYHTAKSLSKLLETSVAKMRELWELHSKQRKEIGPVERQLRELNREFRNAQ